MNTNADEVPQAGEPASFSLDKSGIWFITTRSGARLLIAIVLAPESGAPIVTATRYATLGNGSLFNGIPMTCRIGPPDHRGALGFVGNPDGTPTRRRGRWRTGSVAIALRINERDQGRADHLRHA